MIVNALTGALVTLVPVVLTAAVYLAWHVCCVSVSRLHGVISQATAQAIGGSS